MNELIDGIRFNKIYFRNRAYDKKQLMRAIDELAAYLSKNIKSTSPFIVFTAYNHIKTVMAFYAIIKLGKIAVILDPHHKELEVAEIIEDVDPGVMVLLNETTMTFDYDEEIVFRKTNPHQAIHSDISDVCVLAYTNAEDGYSKGAMLTHKNILSEIDALKKTNRINEKANVCGLVPTSHLYGLVLGILAPMHSGGNCVIKELNLYGLDVIMQELRNLGVTHYYTLPSVYYLMSKIDGIEHLLDKSNEFISGGIKLPRKIFDSFYKKTNIRIREGYGLTECAPGVAMNFEKDSRIIDTVGYELPGIKIKVRNKDKQDCSVGEVGEICVKGDMVFKGYYNNIETTRNVLVDEWLYSGDYGYFDSSGRLYFDSLKKNMFNVSGNNIYPKKLQRLMMKSDDAALVEIKAEDSFLQGQSVVANVHLTNNSAKGQQAYKEWCFNSINNTILPKKWNFI